MTEPDFWNDNIAAQKTSQELNELKNTYNTFRNMEELQDKVEILLDFLVEDESVRDELVEQLTELEIKAKNERKRFLSFFYKNPYNYYFGEGAFCIFVYYEEISTNKFLKIYGQKKSLISTIYDKMEVMK